MRRFVNRKNHIPKILHLCGIPPLHAGRLVVTAKGVCYNYKRKRNAAAPAAATEGDAMKLFHLSDLHLGKRLCEQSLLEDQREILRRMNEQDPELKLELSTYDIPER